LWCVVQHFRMENPKKRKLEGNELEEVTVSPPSTIASLSPPVINISEILQNLQKHLLNEK
jgi:hypothetical protein